jgi:hypothetical protein
MHEGQTELLARANGGEALFSQLLFGYDVLINFEDER